MSAALTWNGLTKSHFLGFSLLPPGIYASQLVEVHWQADRSRSATMSRILNVCMEKGDYRINVMDATESLSDTVDIRI